MLWVTFLFILHCIALLSSLTHAYRSGPELPGQTITKEGKASSAEARAIEERGKERRDERELSTPVKERASSISQRLLISVTKKNVLKFSAWANHVHEPHAR